MNDRVERVTSLAGEGPEAIRSGAIFAFTCDLSDDIHPGDWYIIVEVLCRDQVALNQARGKVSFRNLTPIEGFPAGSYTYSTQFVLSGRHRKAMAAEQDELIQVTLPKKAKDIMAMLAQLTNEVTSQQTT